MWIKLSFILIAKEATQDVSRIQTRASETRKTPRSNNMKNFRKKIPFYSGVSQEVIL